MTSTATNVRPCPVHLGHDPYTGAQISFDLATDAHMLVAGRTGTGRTVLLKTLIADLASDPAVGRVDVIDLLPVGFNPSGVQVHARDPRQITDLVTDLGSDLELRYTDMATESWGGLAPHDQDLTDPDQRADHRVRVLVVDQADELAAHLARADVDPGPVLNYLTRVLSVGQTVGIHLVVGLSHPERVTPLSQPNSIHRYGLRLVLGAAELEQRYVLRTDPLMGALSIPGHALAVRGFSLAPCPVRLRHFNVPVQPTTEHDGAPAPADEEDPR